MDDEEIASNPTMFDEEESFEEEVITDINNAFNAEAERRKNRTKDTLEEQKIKYQELQEEKKEHQKLRIEDKPQTLEEAIHIFKKRGLLSYAVCERLADCFEDAKDTDVFRFNTARIIYNAFGKTLPTIGESPNEMDPHAKNIFKKVYDKIKVDMSVEKKLVAAQEITDIMLNISSPVASNEDLKIYGECYAIQSMNNSDIQKLTGCNDDIDELMQRVKEDLGLVKEHVKFKDEKFKDAPVATVPKIEEVKQNASCLNNGK